MTKKEHIRITNLAKISTVITILNDVVIGDDYGIPKQDAFKIMSLLKNTESKIWVACSNLPEGVRGNVSHAEQMSIFFNSGGGGSGMCGNWIEGKE